MKGKKFQGLINEPVGKYDLQVFGDKWCVELDNKRFHIHQGYRRGPRPEEVRVVPCDHTCTHLSDIPDEIWQKANTVLRNAQV